MGSTTPVTDSQMRRADSMVPTSVVIAAPAARKLELELNTARREIERLLVTLDASVAAERNGFQIRVDAVCAALHLGINIQAQDLIIIRERVRAVLGPNV